MEVLATACEPRIASGAVPPHAILSLTDLEKHLECLQSAGSWKKGVAGHQTLPLYFNDGATGLSRPCLVQFKGHSIFGVSFFKGKKKDGEEEDEPKDKKDKKKSATIAFEEEAGDIQKLDTLLNASVESIMKEHLPVLKTLLCPNNEDVYCIQRKASRASSGAIKRNLRATCYAGRVQLMDDSGKKYTMKDFISKLLPDADYICVAEIVGIDASFEKDVLSYGPTLHAKIVQQTKLQLRKELKLRDDLVQEEKEDSWIPPNENVLKEKLAKAAEERMKLKEKEKKDKKDKEKEKTKKKKRKAEE